MENKNRWLIILILMAIFFIPYRCLLGDETKF
jgi:hypothetical protein